LFGNQVQYKESGGFDEALMQSKLGRDAFYASLGFRAL